MAQEARLRAWLTGEPRLVHHSGSAMKGRDVPGGQGRVLADILVMRRGRPLPADMLADLSWG